MLARLDFSVRVCLVLLASAVAILTGCGPLKVDDTTAGPNDTDRDDDHGSTGGSGEVGGTEDEAGTEHEAGTEDETDPEGSGADDTDFGDEWGECSEVGSAIVAYDMTDDTLNEKTLDIGFDDVELPFGHGDFDGDGATDLLMTRSPAGPSLVFGPLVPASERVVLPSDGLDLVGFASGDLDGDGSPELVLSLNRSLDNTESLSLIHLTDTRVVEQLPLERIAERQSTGKLHVALGDVTGDGHSDIVATGPTLVSGGASHNLVVYPGDGALGFGAAFWAAFTHPSGEVGFTGTAIGLGHADDDEILDVLTMNTISSYSGTEPKAFLLTYSGLGPIVEPAVVHTDVAMGYLSGAFVDLDGDTLRDAVIESGGNLLVAPGRNDGTFDDAVVAATAVQSNFDDPMDVGNVDGRGGADLLVGNETRVMFLSDGQGGLGAPWSVDSASHEVSSYRSSIFADIDNDGIDEIVARLVWCGG